MGNVLSEEAAEETFLKEGFDLESPEADKEINFGASAPRCQPKHTEEQQAAADTATETDSSSDEVNSQAATTENNDKAAASQGGTESADDKESDEAGGKQKLSYIQMARMGYQELVNAIIRPPRADYKVCDLDTMDESSILLRIRIDPLLNTFFLCSSLSTDGSLGTAGL
jgi:hypothetical protein